MTRTELVLLLAVLLVPAASEAKPTEDVSLPLEAGFVWHYQGKVRWTEGQSVREKKLHLRIRVVESVRRGNQTVARLDGWLSQLAWYRPSARSSERLLIHDPAIGLLVIRPADATKTWASIIANPKESVEASNIGDVELFVVSDLRRGRSWSLDNQRPSGAPAGWWEWRVERTGTQDLSDIHGWTPRRAAPFFRIAYRTNPDHTVFSFVPGLGITHFTYVHHRTVSECDMRLVGIARTAVRKRQE